MTGGAQLDQRGARGKLDAVFHWTARWFLVAATALGCSSGELHLSEGSTGGSHGTLTTKPSGSGGERATDTDSQPETSDTDASFSSFGGANASEYEDDDTSCPPDDPWCRPCASSEDCYLPYDSCDLALGACVECLSEQDCQSRYDDFLPLCSAGRCVQCQTNEDCPSDLVCTSGFCIPPQ